MADELLGDVGERSTCMNERVQALEMTANFGGLVFGDLAWRPPTMLVVQIMLLTTAQALVMVTGAVVVSSQTTSTRAANLLASFIIIPMALLIQGESAIMFLAPDAESPNGIGALWARKELLDAFRDRRMMLVAFVVIPLAIPLIPVVNTASPVIGSLVQVAPVGKLAAVGHTAEPPASGRPAPPPISCACSPRASCSSSGTASAPSATPSSRKP